MKNLISVIIPAYNHEKYVQETIKSIVNQTYENIELIIIDDGSRDSTWKKINELKPQCIERFKNVVFEKQENQGTCKTLNKLISIASGEYIYLIASDDIAKPEALSLLSEFLSKNLNYSLVVGNNELIDSESKIVYLDKDRNLVYNEKTACYKTFRDMLKTSRPDINFSSKDFGTYNSLLIGNYIPNGFIIRKSIFNKIKHFTPEAPLEDYFMMLQISKYSKIKYIDKILYSYRQHDSNTTIDIEHMENMTKKTQDYERQMLKNVDITKFSKDIQFGIKYGGVKKIFSIPFIFRIFKTRNSEFKRTFISIFGIKIIIKEKKVK